MASSSSSSSSSTLIQKHDVFLSFRGEDTRDNFTSHLYAALRRKKIGTYIDYNGLKKGDEISPALVEAIRESKISVIIFSKNYASSTWCLDELVHIISCKEGINGQLVIPVFYGVDPSHVRKQQGSYATALAALGDSDKVERWREALASAASLSGWDSSVIKPEDELIQRIVKDILKKLRHTAEDEYKNLVGIQKHIEKIESLLHIGSPDVQFIGIWGMPGIGKTTTARVVFDRLSYDDQFEGCCFVENIEENLKTLGREGLRNKVLSTLLDDNMFSNLTKFGGSSFYEARLRQSKVLIVLDDLKDSEQLRLLAGDEDWFGPGSRIIVTTEDKQVLRNKIDNNQIYEVEGLNSDEALELFSLNAFRKNSPTTDCIEVAKTVANYCKGNPLALNVLGSFFGGKSKERWKDALEKLKTLPNDEIQNVLKMSYDGLDRLQKDIFLDIACFFQGQDRDHVERILDACDFSASTGIDDLIDKSLLTVVNNKLRMHGLLQEMGHEIIRQQSIKNPRKQSRLWLAKDVYNVLRDNTGTPKIEGLFMDMSEIDRELYLSCTVFQRMLNLRFLKFYNFDAKKKRKVYLPENLRYLPNMLRYLHWDGYPAKALPANFSAEYLVELIMPNSQVEELWSGVQDLTNLKKIDLSYSENLSNISSLCGARNLEHVYLEYCGSVTQVPLEFKHLDKLKTLILEGCSSLKAFPELPSNIECLLLSGTEIEEVPSSIQNLTQLHILSMRDCKRLVSLPTSICKLKLLFSLSLSGCANLERLPEINEPMWSLMVLELDNTSIETLPITIGNLIDVEHLTLPDHKLIPQNICTLRSSKCISLIQLRSLMDQDSRHPYHFFNKRHCPEEKIVIISTSVLIDGLRDSAFKKVIHSQSRELLESHFSGEGEFLFYNYVQLPGYINHIKDTSKLKLFHAQIESRSSNQRGEFLATDFGFCCISDTKIPNWFSYQFEDTSSVRIRLDKHELYTLLAFSVCVVVGLEDFKYFSNHKKCRLVCQVHYQLRDGRVLSSDFCWNENHGHVLKSVLEPNFRSEDMLASPKSRASWFDIVHNMILPEVVFDFGFVDENNKRIQALTIKRCGIHLQFEKDFIKRFAFFGPRGQSNAVGPRGSTRVTTDIDEEEEESKKLSDDGIVVSISRSELTQHFDQSVFLFYGFLQLHGRNGMDHLKVKVFDQEILSHSNFKGVLGSSNEDVGAYCQGSEIPYYFKHKCDKPQMWVELPVDSLVDSNLLGFVLYAVVEFKDLNCFNRFKLQYQYGISIPHHSSRSAGILSIRNYLWTFKLRCVDENINPLGDNQCKIRTCAIKRVYAGELGIRTVRVVPKEKTSFVILNLLINKISEIFS